MSNAIQTTDNEMSHLIIYCLNCIRRDWNATYKTGLRLTYRIKWNEASILATESHKFSRKMRESIEIEKHCTIDQEGKPLNSTWRALFTVQN